MRYGAVLVCVFLLGSATGWADSADIPLDPDDLSGGAAVSGRAGHLGVMLGDGELNKMQVELRHQAIHVQQQTGGESDPGVTLLESFAGYPSPAGDGDAQPEIWVAIIEKAYGFTPSDGGSASAAGASFRQPRPSIGDRFKNMFRDTR